MALTEQAGSSGSPPGGTRVELDDELSGLDRLEAALPSAPSRVVQVWSAAWPKVAAIVLGLAVWQIVVWSHWKPSYVLPGPFTVFRALGDNFTSHLNLLKSTGVTLQRAAVGYLIALVVGTILGVAVAQNRILRSAVGSLITGFMTMPSVAWLPLAIVLFQLSERAILFVLLIGAIPSIANGVISGIDNTPPILLRAGQVLGARGIDRYRRVVLPAALPGFVAGMKQGWAFTWRSLMAGELIVIVSHRPSLGQALDQARNFSDYPGMMATMVVILVVGLVLDSVVFGRLERTVLRRRGLASTA
jgi:NitT/TauT family transport system permease protein